MGTVRVERCRDCGAMVGEGRLYEHKAQCQATLQDHPPLYPDEHGDWVAANRGAALTAMDRMTALGRAGFTVSICCGPSGADPLRWSVQVLAPNGAEFDRPFAAQNFAHAVEIAEREIQRRGWAAAG